MKQYAVYLFQCKTTLHVSGVLRGQVRSWPRWREVAALTLWLVPEAVVTVSCTPDDGCARYPKHVERSCGTINRLHTIASCWTVINIDLWCTEPWTKNSKMLQNTISRLIPNQDQFIMYSHLNTPFHNKPTGEKESSNKFRRRTKRKTNIFWSVSWLFLVYQTQKTRIL